MISGCQFAIFHCEYINRHCLEALAGRFRSEQLACGCAGSFTAHYDLIAERLDILNSPAQIWDGQANHFKYIGQFFAVKPLFVRVK